MVSIVAERGLKGWMVWGEGWVVPENRRDRGRRLGLWGRRKVSAWWLVASMEVWVEVGEG